MSKKRFNLRLLAIAGGVLVVLGVAVHFVHALQVRRNAGILRTQGLQAADEGQPDRAARFLSAYLDLVPGDGEARAAYGEALDRIGTPAARRNAVTVLAGVVKAQPERQDLRRRLVAAALATDQTTIAQPHVDALLAASPDDGVVELYRGRIAEGEKDYAGAAEWFGRAAQHKPELIEAHIRLANLLRKQLDRGAEADEAIDRMVKANPKSADAFYERGRYRESLAVAKPALDDYVQAARLAPTRPELFWPVLNVAWAIGDVPTARSALDNLLLLEPQNSTPYHLMVLLERRAGRPDEAEAVARRGLELSSPDDGDLLFDLTDLLLESNRTADAEVVLKRMQRSDVPAEWQSFLRGELQMRQGKLGEAVRTLEAIRKPGAPAELLGRANQTLARCHERMGDPESRLDAWRRAVAAEPLSPTAHAGLGAALVALGRLDEAAAQYKQAVGTPGAPAWVRLDLIRLLASRNRILPEQQRDWAEVDRQLTQAEKASADDPTLTVLRADVLVARGAAAKARALLEKDREKHPKRVDIWVALSAAAEAQGRTKDARDLLEQARERVGDRVELRLAAARQELRRGEAGVERLRKAEENLDGLPEPDRGRLLAGLTEMYLSAAKRDDAGRTLKRLVSLQPDELRWRLLLADLLVEAGPEGEAKSAVAELRRVEGDDGVLWRYAESVRLLRQAQQGETGVLPEARRLQSEAQERRPNWSRLALLAAHLDELEQKPEKALENYLRAVELGDRQPAVLRRTRELLAKHDAGGRGAAVLDKVKD